MARQQVSDEDLPEEGEVEPTSRGAAPRVRWLVAFVLGGLFGLVLALLVWSLVGPHMPIAPAIAVFIALGVIGVFLANNILDSFKVK